jgi:signal transduction histidine kinase
MFNSLRSRLIASYLLVVFLSLSLASLLFYQFLARYTIQTKKQELVEQTKALAQLVSRLENRESLISPTRVLNLPEKVLKARIFLVKPSGEIITRSQARSLSRAGIDLEALRKGEIVQVERDAPQLGGKVIIVAVPFEQNSFSARSDFSGALVAVSTVRELTQTQRPVLIIFLVTALISLIISGILGFLLSSSIIKPLTKLNKAALEVAQGHFDHQVEVTSPDEVGRLARTFNYMAASLKQAYQVQKDFLANVAHELKTPLTSIEGFSEALIENVASSEESRKKSLRIINQEAKRLSKLVKDILLASTLEAGKLKLELTEVDMGSFLRKLGEKYKSMAREKNISFKVTEKGTGSILTDGDRLEQVLTNLLDNAFKHTQVGQSIELKSFKEKGKIVIQLSDSGPGIPPEDLPRIFDRFYLVEKSRSRQAGGTGLGLAISKEIVEALGGKIEVASQLGRGTTFTITLPST